MATNSQRGGAQMPHLLAGTGFGQGGQHARTLEKPRDPRGSIRRLWDYLRRQRKVLVLAASTVCAMVVLDMAGPLLLGKAIDECIVPRDLPGLGWMLSLMVVIYGASALLNLTQSYIMAGASQQTMRDIRADLFEKLQHLPLKFFDSRSHGELMSRLTSDVETINQVLSNSVTQLVSGGLTTLAVTVAMFFINPVLAAVSVVTVSALTIGLNRWIARRTRERYRQQQAALGRLYGYVEEIIGGQKVVKAYRREDVAIRDFDEANEVLRRNAVRAQTFAGLTPPVMNTINNIALMIVGGVGGWMAIRGMTSIGTIAIFISYTRQFGRPLNEIANLYNSIQSAMAGAERVFEVIDEAPETDADPSRLLPPVRGEVIFDGVCFSYREGLPVLKEVSLQARPGETIALIGPTGAGKTTIVNLLTRFYEIQEGSISVDGHDIRRLPKAWLRRQLGVVLQDTFLFSASVRDNIRYGRLDAGDEEIFEAARLANAEVFIHRLPQGYDTILSERGGNLSHGQRQLLAIARAILADPRILILDEATSSVDTRTEQHIQEAMKRLMRGRTSFVIAHRLSTIREADQILVIDQGRIIERGTHAELLALRGFYHRLSSKPGSRSGNWSLMAEEEREMESKLRA